MLSRQPFADAFDAQPRTRLHPLEPRALGTGGVESLSGYIARLALAHRISVRTLLGDAIEPQLRASGSFIGIGSLPRILTEESAQAIDVDIAWAAALAKLTGQSGALELTFGSWASALAPRSLLRTEAAYCPQCFGCDLETGRPYERLLWRLASVKVCPVHRNSLLSACWTCRRRRRALASWSIPGYCPECWAWLGWSGREAQPASPEPTPWSIASTNLIEQALAKRSAVPLRGDILRGSMTSALGFVGGNRAELTRLLGLRSKTSVNAWLDGTSRPRLDTVLRLAAATGADLSSVLAGAPIFDVRERMRPPDSKAHRRLDWAKIGNELEREVRRTKPRTLTAMALHYELDDREIKSHFRALTRQLVERRATARSLEALERRSRLVAQVEGIITRLQRDGVYPNRRRVEAEMPPGVDLREAPLGAAWRRLRAKESTSQAPAAASRLDP